MDKIGVFNQYGAATMRLIITPWLSQDYGDRRTIKGEKMAAMADFTEYSNPYNQRETKDRRIICCEAFGDEV